MTGHVTGVHLAVPFASGCKVYVGAGLRAYSVDEVVRGCLSESKRGGGGMVTLVGWLVGSSVR